MRSSVKYYDTIYLTYRHNCIDLILDEKPTLGVESAE